MNDNAESKGKVGYCNPPVEHRFKTGNKIKGGRPKGSISVSTELRKMLGKNIQYEDPETHKQVKGKIAHVIALRLILNACEGEYSAIKDILDRIDGKPVEKREIIGQDDGPLIICWSDEPIAK